MVSTPLEILERYWGHKAFRPKQEDIVRSVLNGNDTLALLPTGGGKSVCFQVPALGMQGMCLVISPLLALMQDQVNNLRNRGITAEAVTSAMNIKEIDNALDLAVHGKTKFLYVSPERLKNHLFLERLKRMQLSLIAVDEAHCISQWGYDFRPSYLEIAAIRSIHPNVPILALTASATPAVVSDIQNKLQFKLPNVLGNSFARPNLTYVVIQTEQKEQKLFELLRKIKGSAVVYCGTRARTKEVAHALIKQHFSADIYHAGLTEAEKENAFKRWMRNDVRVICATNAFGMGIDKPDVRVVIHMDVPASPEAYFQEAGRAGRDGEQAYGVMLYHEADIILLREKVKAKFPPKKNIAQIYNKLCNHFQLAIGAGKESQFDFDLSSFVKTFQLQGAETVYALQLLESAGYLALSDGLFQSSKLHISAGKQGLYSFQVANAQLDPFIKQLLRMYGGMFEHFVPIKESDIARRMRTSETEVIRSLELIAKQGIFEYLKSTQTPKITFLTGRQDESKIRLPKEIYEDRIKSDVDRIEAMISYLEKDTCRSIQLLEYFGERNTEACGKCDVCRAHARQGLEASHYEKIWREMQEVLLHQSPTPEELAAFLAHHPAEEVGKVIRWKLDNEELVMDNMLRITLPGLLD